MKTFEITWKSVDGLKIFARGWEPDTGSPLAVVCLVHGLGEHTLRYIHVAEAFTREGLILFGSDMRGHGNSEGTRGHFPSIEIVMKDIDLLLNQAHQRYPGLPLFLYGHSLGGILVLHYGLKQKADLKGVISSSPGLHNALEKQPLKIVMAKILGTLLPSMTIPSGLDISALSHDPEVVSAYKNDPLVHGKISTGFGRVMLKVNRWTLEHAGEFPHPLLLLHGMADTIAFPSSSKDFANAVKGKCTLAAWDDMYHELHNEPVKDEVYRTIKEFIKDQLA